MTDAGAGGLSRPVHLRRFVAIAIAALPAASAALAADAPLERVLLEQGCVGSEITTLLKQGDLVVYRANCLGSSHRVIDISCSKGRCRRNLSGEEQDR